MKKLWLAAAVATVFVLMSLGLGHYWLYAPKPDGKYDNNNYFVSPKTDFKRMKNATVQIIAETEYEYDGGKKHKKFTSLVGVVFAGVYALSAGHAVAKDGYVTIATEEGDVAYPAKVVSRNFTAKSHRGYPIVSLKLLYVNHEKDFALYELELPSGSPWESFPYDIGNSNELKEGNFVYIIGNPLGDGINIRDGTVNALRWQGGKPLHPDAKEEYFFMVNVSVIRGDSGGVILAIRDGKYELVGIVSATYMSFNELGFIVKINVIRDAVQSCAVCPPELKRLFAVSKTKKAPHL